ncbi:hypothetical protein TGPRC2_245475 [Toxoplasma gondii TgCatPRC2]|uniref:Uncharacterized protein n=15 Tax=Toxoplasma gondii TaxID=5811 RepID=A0A125YGR0_TOXGV|nr:hypothetical protein TGME49_245475 [Toxoplasma gondii ME49]EPR63745.1 hypothetical protein TGGT1_245475 [Toxoplasma gondii GT1]ESS34049.1 hypothetical protein TGVEG_245475 [Toxoplasma gondii VEG]KAF4638400.1 hypothetical protein TGRH88_060090 [Toxoplasma gondii]KFG33864.1 hypothetical protein TGFOU_245475 [Toxoplasma gondii FOU]KFG47161.1 hypothetical protein TGDOM2_245475 [Toxoplasma gondii GAB2-2007-GAL-DOM2]KFG47605.1 hypothetical protein TGP89_245475 [Toxoplasma gondii p89]KFG64674.1 |eukprot:XP_018634882.1 hypothetical protein TGME49_245475 [Toxoplasma gondii ME49]
MDGQHCPYGNVPPTSHEATMRNFENPMITATNRCEYVLRAFTTPTRPCASLITSEELESYLHLKQPLPAYLQSYGPEASPLQDYVPSNNLTLDSSGSIVPPTLAATTEEIRKAEKRQRTLCCCGSYDE